MVLLITAAVLVFGYVVAQDQVCDLRQNVGANEQYYVNNPEYPYYYNAGRTCRYIAICPTGYNCRSDCYLEMPSTINCSGDRFLVSRSGDPTLAGAERYCGVQRITAISTGTTLSMGLITTTSSTGGRYQCNVTAQRATPAPAPTCRCGERKRTRIVGGEVTKPNEYPMMAGLLETSTNSIHCGGVIIANRYVMTAAHCVYNYRPSGLTVIVGTHFIDEGRTGTQYLVAQFIVHEQFNINTYDYDVALVQTQQAMAFYDNVQPVCLPFKYTSNPDLTGNLVTLLGWGTTSFGGPTSNPLRKVDVSIISQTTCRRTENNVSDRQFCTLARGKDACQFDSGGPVLYEDPSTGLLMSVGAVSSGVGCGTARPGINTRITSLLNWIVSRAPNANFCNIR